EAAIMITELTAQLYNVAPRHLLPRPPVPGDVLDWLTWLASLDEPPKNGFIPIGLTLSLASLFAAAPLIHHAAAPTAALAAFTLGMTPFIGAIGMAPARTASSGWWRKAGVGIYRGLRRLV